ncbi:steroid receptor RNA activator 1 [Cyprinodon tularosa]|uniref:steroid receptor RNA activator 1 n=1 Tax=Cyprinodon variegatus TaxID=28743 RepID=UPI00074261BA|nr:PREDICTED: steroid receptor RNA activator 1 [Cyprinodon variegatus]XP_038156631.1 steroid receptor RNA activator 1 [Cyprinodon tularosa]
MEDMYVKPGNQERGWNDPPQFSYGLQMARGPPRTALNKRAVPALSSGAEASPTAPSPSRPMAPPMCGIAPPPLPAGPPPAGLATPPIHGGPMRSQSEADGSQSEPDIEVVMSVLNRALDACRQSVKVQVCNEVAKRLRLLEDSWRSGKLSLPVTRRMETLSQALQSGRWDSADELHRSLMVDHVTEVSQWMVGVKRLIAETRNLSPEHLKPLQSSAEPVQESTRGVEDSVEPDQDTEAEQGPEEMDLHPVEPVQDLVSQS